MKFRPCIDIHNGKVKQIVGGSLKDQNNQAKENFVSEQDAAFYADFYQSKEIRGGHIILLNPVTSSYYEETKRQAMMALRAYPQGLQVGGGIRHDNAEAFLDAGASHVIVTSYVFKDGKVSWEKLDKIQKEVGKEHLVLDLSCRKKDDKYFIVTDRWQNFTQVQVTKDTLQELSSYCDEFLVHAVDVEGKASGIEVALVELLADCGNISVTYAGGVGNFEHLQQLKKVGKNRVDVTVGSALDLFGGTMSFEKILKFCK